MIRYDFADLEDAMQVRPEPGNGQMETTGALARQLGVNRQQVLRYRKEGLRPLVADKLAVRAGFHPSLVWPSWFADALAEQKCAWCQGPLSMKACRPTTYCGGRCKYMARSERLSLERRQAAWWRRMEEYRDEPESEVPA